MSVLAFRADNRSSNAFAQLFFQLAKVIGSRICCGKTSLQNAGMHYAKKFELRIVCPDLTANRLNAAAHCMGWINGD